LVVHGHDAGVTDRVRDVALAQETSTDRRIERELRVQELDRDALLVAVLRFVHRGHAADAEEALEPPFASERRSDSRKCARSSAIVAHRTIQRTMALAGSAFRSRV